MAYPSSSKLLKRAAQKNQRGDRWAAIQSNMAQREKYGEEKAVSPHMKTEEKTKSVSEIPADTGKTEREIYVQGHPNLKEPPFPPPQARHTALDEIQKKHQQALKSAMPAREWRKGETGNASGEKERKDG